MSNYPKSAPNYSLQINNEEEKAKNCQKYKENLIISRFPDTLPPPQKKKTITNTIPRKTV